MSTAVQFEHSCAYEIRYFENGEMQTMTVFAPSKQAAHEAYLQAGKFNCDLFSIRPDS
ncbi:RNA helicase [Vibrio sp. SM6]|uniref:RNA helicase n=1 Tax=Vibrio agarilyticus TaxID=2726741 RepID=A0A7X8TTL7_9VIBR|nr:RNA helicase [Vibrio agarilyticus]NLS14565.1 RNA helicase [Vibrio agarilyticus]